MTRKQPTFILHAFSFCERHFWLTLQKQVAQNVSRVTNSISWWFGVEKKINLINMCLSPGLGQLFHVSFANDSNCQEIINRHFGCIKCLYPSG